MPYCPKCREKYETDEVCPDCEVDLIQEEPVELPSEYEDAEWVELHYFQGPIYAQMAVEMLHNEGIPAYSKSTFFSGAYGISGGGYIGGDTPVFVLEPDQEQAYAIIEPIIEEMPEMNMDGEDYDE